MTSATLTQSDIETTNSAIGTQLNTVSLQALPSSIREQIIAEVAELHLPVFLRQDGGFDLPETSFDEAWKNIGTRMKLGVAESPTVPEEPIETVKTAKTPSAPRLMNKVFGADDVFRGKNGTSRTLQAFLAKVNLKGRTQTEVLQAIASQDEYGKQLIQKLYEGYSKKIGNMTDTQWSEILDKLINEAGKMLNPDNAEVAEEVDE